MRRLCKRRSIPLEFICADVHVRSRASPRALAQGNACTNEWSCPMTARTYLLVVAATIVLMLLFGLTGKNVATNTTQQNAEAVSGSQNR